MTVVSVLNYKGGVGKTTVAANLAAEVALRGRRVLLIDMDPQASLTLSFYAADELAKRPAERNAVREQCAQIAENELDGQHVGNERAQQIADLIRASKEPEFNVGAPVHASDVDPTAGLNPNFAWDGKDQ